MLPRLLLVASLLLLGACQSIQTDYDYNTRFDFSRPLSWQWRQPAVSYTPDDPRYHGSLNEQRILAAVEDGLLQRGLRPAAAGQRADLQAQVFNIIDQRQQMMTTYYGGEMIATRHGYISTPLYADTHNLYYNLVTLQIDLYDASGALVWRGSGVQQMPNGPLEPAEREQLIRQTVSKILEGYPPRR